MISLITLSVDCRTPMDQTGLESLLLDMTRGDQEALAQLYHRTRTAVFGLTLSYLRELLRDRHPNSIKIVTLLNKPARRTADIQPDYCCFEVPDEFVVGYGLDFDERYRNLPYVGVLKEEVYQG